VLVSTAVIAATVTALAAVHGPGAIILGGGLALSSTAVAMQVLASLTPLYEILRTGSSASRATCQIPAASIVQGVFVHA
jgi:hypothetical protein